MYAISPGTTRCETAPPQSAEVFSRGRAASRLIVIPRERKSVRARVRELRPVSRVRQKCKKRTKRRIITGNKARNKSKMREIRSSCSGARERRERDVWKIFAGKQ